MRASRVRILLSAPFMSTIVTDTNHTRKNRAPADRRYAAADYRNGYPRWDGKVRFSGGELIPRAETQHRVGSTGYLDKSMHGWGGLGKISGHHVGASIGNDFANGHRGMARAVKGAKKFVRSRLRFHENQATRTIASLAQQEDF